MKERPPAIQYGARLSGSGKPTWVYWMKESDFFQELKLAFFETKDLDKSLERVKAKVMHEVRERVS